MPTPRRTRAVPLLASVLSLLIPAFARAADDPAPAAQPAAAKAVAGETFAQISKEMTDAQQAFMEVYRAAKDDAERQKLVEEKYPRPEKYAGRFVAFAEKNPDDPTAVEALTRVVGFTRSGPDYQKALSLLTTRYIDSPKLAELCQSLVYSGDPSAEAALKTILDKSPSREVKGQACYALGAWNMHRNNGPEAEKRFQQVIESYADLKSYRGTLGEAAKAQLFEAHNLVVGKTAPEIEGEDVDGKSMKLSQYRGKVVVLDFWGDW
jgi:TolA-binding protein